MLLGMTKDVSLNCALHMHGLSKKLSTAMFVLRRPKDVDVHNETLLVTIAS